MAVFAPFGVMYTLNFSDGDFDVPQNLFGQIAGRDAEGVGHIRRIEVGNALKIFLVQNFCGVDAAPRHHGIRYATGEGFLKRRTERGIVRFLNQRPGEVIRGGRLQRAVFRTVEDFAAVVPIILRSKLPCNAAEGVREGTVLRNVLIILREFGENRRLMLMPHFPQLYRAGFVEGRLGVAHVEDVFQLRVAPAVVDEGDS
ncbi:MAG: hypothetical protein LBR76_00245, partial [Oscillospiraceae bacterium]|nr:hypothetical protein [Oscillospiraceae bacterium]